MTKKSIIGITMGDFNGIGPEVIIKSLSDEKTSKYAVPVLVGSRTVFERVAEELKVSVKFNTITKPDEIKHGKSVINIFDIIDVKPEDITPGIPTSKSFQTSLDVLHYGINIAKNEYIKGLVTGPICKEALVSTNFPGQTELIAKSVGIKTVVMMMVSDDFRVALATTHSSIKKVSGLLSKNLIIDKLTVIYDSLKNDFGIRSPKIAVCSLNPHSGEGGLFGNEEKEIIRPAVEHLNKQNLNINGPYPSDTLFIPTNRKKYDAILAMYHDQGLIPFKIFHFHNGVNFSAGLPFIRTSPDHGTAYDIAGDFLADESSMKEAILLNAQLCNRKKG